MGNDFRIAAWLIQPRLNALSRNGTTVHLEPKVMEVLACLAEHAGEAVPKEQLLQTVWPNTFVTDDVLKRSISELRRVFEDDAHESHVIQTIAKRGYRLVAPVEPVNGTKQASRLVTSAPVRTTGGFAHRWWIGAGVATVVLGVFFVVNRTRSATAGGVPPVHSLAVLPLQNLSGDPAQEYFSDGMTDGLITDLAQISSLKVISRTSSMQYKQTKKSLPEIARELNVDGIVEGTVQRSGNRLLVNTQLIHGPSDKHLWASSYEGDFRDLFALERHVTEDVARQVQAKLTKQEPRAPAQPRVTNAEALEAYLQGNFHLHRFSRGSGDEELKLASGFFGQATAADPNFASAYAGMSTAHRRTLRSSNEDEEIARKAAERSVELDPTLSEAWKVLGDVRYDFWDWRGAEEDYRRAIALNPSNADAHELLAVLLDAMGQPDEAWKEYQIAQQLDPIQGHLQYALFKRHEYDQAIELNLTMLGSDPNNGYLHHQLYEFYSAKGMHKEAVQQLEQTYTLYGFPQVADKLRSAFAASGYMRAMREYGKELERLHTTKQLFIPVNMAVTYAALGDKDRAFYWLEQGYKNRGNHTAGVDIAEITVHPGLDTLRSDPRFKDLLRRIGLPP